MTELTRDLSLAQARSLIDSYAFDLEGGNAEHLIEYWLDLYHASWIRLATIEALYLGRYKAISIEHILNVWLRLGTPNTHFTYEFERLICRRLPKHLSNLSSLSSIPDNLKETNIEPTNYQPKSTVRVDHTRKPSEQPTIATTEINTPNPQQVFSDRQKPSPTNISIISALGFSSQADWSEFTRGDKVIHQFIPLPDVSSFFNKLKTFGEQKLEG